MLTGSDGTLTEGQNHTLTCTASGGGSMAYTYMWLRNGSSQTLSTYSFSPLRVVDSGRYNCRVSLGSTSITSGAVTITVLGELDMLMLRYVLPNRVYYLMKAIIATCQALCRLIGRGFSKCHCTMLNL